MLFRFTFPAWMKRRFPVSRTTRGPKRSRRRYSFHPQVRALEDRLAPSSFTVTDLTDNPPSSATETNGLDSVGKISLRSAIVATNNLGGSNTIILPAGTYDLSQGQLNIKNNLTLTGAAVSGTALAGNLAPTTIINAQFTSRIFQIFNGFTVTISNVTLEEGKVVGTLSSPAQGAGIFDSGALTLKNDILKDNLAFGANGAAGATGPNGANGTLTTAATAGSPGVNGLPGGDAEGGAIYVANAPGAALTFLNTVVGNLNEAVPGLGGNGGPGGNGGSGSAKGAPGGSGGSGGNSGNGLGGGLYVAGGTVVVQGSIFSGNVAGEPFSFIPQSGGSGGTGGTGGRTDPHGLPGNGGNGGFGGGSGESLGGAIYNAGGNTSILDSSFSFNEAIGLQGGPGGAGGSGGFGISVAGGAGGAGLTGGDGGAAEGGAIINANGAMMKIDKCKKGDIHLFSLAWID